jgi:hypothetical protein
LFLSLQRFYKVNKVSYFIIKSKILSVSDVCLSLCQNTLPDLKEELPTPPEMTIELFKHQKQALAWMVKREESEAPPSGGIIADHMGLGKTMYEKYSNTTVSNYSQQFTLLSKIIILCFVIDHFAHCFV